MNSLGLDKAKGYASKVGIPFQAEDDNLALALGGFSSGVSVAELTSAYMPFASGGYYSPAFVIKEIIKDGETVYKNEVYLKSVLTPQSSFLMTSMLKDVVKSGTAKKLAVPNMEIAAKTGTSGDNGKSYNKDAWIVSYNSEYIIGCWMGYDKTDDEHNLPSGVTGGTYPALLSKQVYEAIYQNKEKPSFSTPSSIIEVELDKKALENDKKAVLASSLTPDDMRLTEFYAMGTQPTQVTTNWKAPKAPNDLNIALSSNGIPILSFSTPESSAEYLLFRTDTFGSKILIGRYNYSSDGIGVIDTTANLEEEYVYYVVAVSKEIKTDGKALSSAPSACVHFPCDP